MRKSILFVASTIPFLFNLSCQSSQELKTEASPSAVSLGGNWKGSMHSLRISVSNLVPYIFNEKKFTDEANTKYLEKEIHSLSKETSRINHDASMLSRDPTVNFISEDFSEQMSNIETAFRNGRKSYARYELIHLTNYCVDCHTRTRQGNDFNFVLTEPFPKDMSSTDRIEYYIASRNFKKAFTESISALKEVSVTQLNIERIAFLGLQVTVQNQADIGKTKELLSTLEQRKDLAYMTRERAKLWQQSVARWKLEKNSLSGLSLVRSLLTRKDANEVDAMRSLHELIPLFQTDLQEDIGEALFLAGQAYEIINGYSHLNLHENYYESCIRRTPGTLWAQKCFDKLENSIVIGYSGSSGTHIPMTIQVKMEKLKKEAQQKEIPK